MTLNLGKFKDNQYIKWIDPSKAVLWKDREISLPIVIMTRILARETEEIVFINKKTYERWVFKVSKIKQFMYKKQEGQEKQYYFPIDLREGVKLKKKEQPINENQLTLEGGEQN